MANGESQVLLLGSGGGWGVAQREEMVAGFGEGWVELGDEARDVFGVVEAGGVFECFCKVDH